MMTPSRQHAIALFAAAAAVTALAGCAAHPADIVPEAIPAREYQSFSCEGLEDALAQAKNNLAEAEKRQKNKRTTDAVGNVLLIPGLMSVVKDSREAVARHKGEVVTITRVLDARCSGENL